MYAKVICEDLLSEKTNRGVGNWELEGEGKGAKPGAATTHCLFTSSSPSRLVLPDQSP